jgi:hypothetical protein
MKTRKSKVREKKKSRVHLTLLSNNTFNFDGSDAKILVIVILVTLLILALLFSA